MRPQKSSKAGSVLVWTVVIIGILSLIAVETLRLVTAKYQNALQTSTWQEALLAAESGLDLAIVELRKSLYPQPNHAWDGWNNPPGNEVTGYELTTVPNAGLNGTPMTIETNVDAPTQLIDPTNSWQYYRIRTVGTIPITGPARTSDNPQDTKLRRLSLRWERFTNGILTPRLLTAPQVSRRVEAVVRPVSAFDQAIMSVGVVDLTNQNIVVDSYDSTDPTKSTNGLYDPAKRQENGDIATDGQLIEAGNAQIHGDVATNAGTVSGAANITGVERTDFYQEPIPVGAPSWSTWNSSPSSVTGTTTITASSEHVSIGGNSQITASIYAPGHDVTVNGSGTNGHVYGSIVGKTVTMTGVSNLHYDERLGSIGLINNYKIVSWFEDNR